MSLPELIPVLPTLTNLNPSAPVETCKEREATVPEEATANGKHDTERSLLSVPVEEVHTRLLYSFSFSRRCVAQVVEKLQRSHFAGNTIWGAFDGTTVPNDYYRTETHEATLASVFGAQSAPRYLQILPAVSSSIFPTHLVMMHQHESIPFRFSQPTSVELFLSPFGVGTLCFNVQVDTARLASAAFGKRQCRAAEVVMFNYRLSKLKQWVAPTIRVTHPRDNPEMWDQIPEGRRNSIPEPPSQSTPLELRMKASGGEYHLSELIEYLFRPMVGDPEFTQNQDQFGVYTVSRFSSAIDFADEAVSMTLSHVLSALAQVEEHTHVGSPLGKPGIVNELLNRNHWAGVGCLGGAHLVVDQKEQIAFNEDRVPRVLNRYFVAFLSAYMQKLAIRHASDTVGKAIQATQESGFDACAADFNRVLKDMIEFNAVAYLPEISDREVINRYYQLAQEGLHVSEAWIRTNQSITNLDVACRTSNEAALFEQQVEHTRVSRLLLEQQTADIALARETLQESKELHAKVEWVEVLIVGVYIAELIEIAGRSFGFHEWIIGIFALTYSAAAMFAAYRLLKPYEHARLEGLRKVVLLSLLALAFFLLSGFWHELSKMLLFLRASFRI